VATTQNDVDQYVANAESEGLYLEFKRGAALTTASNEARNELVKDCTGFANAAGGTIIYGIAETEVNGCRVASGVDPVTDPRTTRDWIVEVLRSNSSPPLSRFEVTELPQPLGARVVAIEIGASGTAHQILRDHRYYQRSGAATAPMVDFQIRDVMARRTKPDASVGVHTRRLSQSPDLHRYVLEVLLENTGSVTLEKWWLDVDLPAAVVRDTRNPGIALMTTQPNFHKVVKHTTAIGGAQMVRISFGDPSEDGQRSLVHPGQVLTLDRSHRNFAEILIEIDQGTYGRVDGTPIRWTLYFNNSSPKYGEVPFENWCRF
jgi:hypothetical protein